MTTLFKFDAAGNDFLVRVDWERAGRFDAAFAVAACDRHHGVGADGLIRISPAERGASFRMDLRNADGSLAETSGNGIRCAVLCALDEGIIRPGRVLVETIAGDVAASVAPSSGRGESVVRVEMGVVKVRELDDSPVARTRAFAGDVGNPHLVLIGESTDDVDLAALGDKLVDSVAGGQNVMAVAVSAEDELDLVPFERGCGFTLACGSGSAVAAVAAYRAGLVSDEVVVHNPGGDLFVEMRETEAGTEATLSGPARRVAEVTIDDEQLIAAEGSGA